MVWLRQDALSAECPKSAITAGSISILERFDIWKRLGGGFDPAMSAKDADALAFVDRLWREEMERVNQE